MKRRMSLPDLIGKRVNQVLISKLTEVIFFITEDGEIFMLAPEGECCAKVFIAHINNPDVFNMAIITSITNIEKSSSDDDSDIVVDNWGHVFHTTAGSCTFECRTSHNGYYGGWLSVEEVDEIPSDVQPLTEF